MPFDEENQLNFVKIVWSVEFYLKKKYVVFDSNIEKKEVEGEKKFRWNYLIFRSFVILRLWTVHVLRE